MQGYQTKGSGVPPAFAKHLERSSAAPWDGSISIKRGRGAECRWGVTKWLLCLRPHEEKGRKTAHSSPLQPLPFPCSILTHR